MTLQEFQQMAQAMGFRVVDNYALGDYNGQYNSFPFEIIVGGTNALSSMTLAVKTEQNISGKVYRAMGKAVKGRATMSGNNQGAVSCLITLKSMSPIQTALEVMGILIPIMEQNGLTPPTTCPICKMGMMDSEAVIGGLHVPVHRHCVEQQSYQNYTAVKKNEQAGAGHRILGILGAIVGAIVGTIPTLILILLLNRLSAWLFMLIPLAAYYGYKKLGGKMDGWVLPIVIVVTLLSTMFMEQVQFYFAVHDYYKIWPMPHETVAYYFEIMTFKDMALDLALPLVFSALGIIFSLGIIRRTNTSEEKDINFVMRTLLVKYGQPAQPPMAQAQPSTAPVEESTQNPFEQQ